MAVSESSPADSITDRLAALESAQHSMVQAMGLMLDTLAQQTNLLRQIADAVKDEPGPSPVMQSLDELTAGVIAMGAGIETVSQQLDALPDAITAAMNGNGTRAEAAALDEHV